jgi:hypothetical protein
MLHAMTSAKNKTVKDKLKKPPDSPTGDVFAWGQQWQQYVHKSWKPSLDESSGVNEVAHEDCVPGDGEVGQEQNGEETTDGAEVEGKLRPLIPEGERIMVCIEYKLVQTRYGNKDYLYWREENSSPILEQFFPHYEKYPVNSKAIENYLIATGERPKRLDRMSFRRLLGLRAEVYVETVKPTYANGALKGRIKPEAMHYSKVSEILRPLGQVDANTLRELRWKP